MRQRNHGGTRVSVVFRETTCVSVVLFLRLVGAASGVGFYALEGARYAKGARDHCGHGGGEHSQVSEPLVWAYAPYRDCGERIFSVV